MAAFIFALGYHPKCHHVVYGLVVTVDTDLEASYVMNKVATESCCLGQLSQESFMAVRVVSLVAYIIIDFNLSHKAQSISRQEVEKIALCATFEVLI